MDKVKSLCSLYVNCLKSIMLNQYERNVINNNNCFEGEIFLKGNRPKSCSHTSSTSDEGNFPKSQLNPNESESQSDGWVPMNDPRTITLKLGKMRHSCEQKFKILNFNVEGNFYAKKVEKI